MSKPPWYNQAFDMIVKFVRDTARTEYNVEELQKAYPFHSLFFRDEAIIAFKRQRSIVTRLGTTLYPRLAQLIASAYYQNVQRDKYRLSGQIDAGMLAAVEQIITQLRTGQREPDHDRELEEIVQASNGQMTQVPRIIADLYIPDFRPHTDVIQPGPLFVEIKSPTPNLDICAESKKKILVFLVLRRRENPHAYLAFPYNPFGSRQDYRHDFTKQVMDMKREVLIGPELWDSLGGPGTYQYLLELIEQVKRETSFPS